MGALVLDEDGFLELVDLGLEEAILDGLNDVAFDIFLVDLQDFGDLGVAGYLDAVEDARNGLDLDVSLEFARIHA